MIQVKQSLTCLEIPFWHTIVILKKPHDAFLSIKENWMKTVHVPFGNICGNKYGINQDYEGREDKNDFGKHIDHR